MNIPVNCQTNSESEKFYQKTQKEFVQKHPLNVDMPYTIVSLGYDCSVRTILTDWGLKPTKEMGELSYPFDLAFCPHEGMLKVLQDNFKDFFNCLSFNQQTQLWENKHYGFFYNHDTDCAENDRKKFVDRFQNRIHNLRKVMEENTPVIFVATIDKASKKNLKRIYEIFNLLKNKRKDKISYLVLWSPKRLFFHPKDVFPIHIQKPFPEYVWWRAEMRYSLGGAKFERKIATKFYKIIQKLIKKGKLK